MNAVASTDLGSRLTLRAALLATDVMTPNPLSLRDAATVKEAMAFLIDHGISAAPVIDRAGRPVGVLSRSDLVVHEREKVEHLAPAPQYYDRADLRTRAGERLPEGFQVENTDQSRVSDLMTPVLFSVTPHTPVSKAVEQMLDLKVHRLFVVDGNGVLVGVISALDILRHLSPE
jgi:CBS domain-containing protein